jgi:hypothetical protein
MAWGTRGFSRFSATCKANQKTVALPEERCQSCALLLGMSFSKANGFNKILEEVEMTSESLDRARLGSGNCFSRRISALCGQMGVLACD